MLMVYMEVVPKPNTVSDRIKAFLDVPQCPDSTEANQEANSFTYILLFEKKLVNYNCS